MNNPEGIKALVEEDVEYVRTFLHLSRTSKPVGQWPGPLVLDAIERLLESLTAVAGDAEVVAWRDREASGKWQYGPRFDGDKPPSYPHEKLYLHPATRQASEGNYTELLYAVASKFPGESRHETALRYIRQAEDQDHGSACSAAPKPADGGGEG